MSKIYSSPKLIRMAEEKNFIFTRILFHFRDLFKTLSKTYFIFMRSRKGVFSLLRKHFIFSFFTNTYKEKKKRYEKYSFSKQQQQIFFRQILHRFITIWSGNWTKRLGKKKRENLQFNRKNSKQVSGVNTKHFCS